jgi:transposase
MLSVTSATRVLVATTPVDLRGSFNRLYSLVVEQLKGDPLSGHLFVFTNGRRNRIKVLYWDGSMVYGFVPSDWNRDDSPGR